MCFRLDFRNIKTLKEGFDSHTSTLLHLIFHIQFHVLTCEHFKKNLGIRMVWLKLCALVESNVSHFFFFFFPF